MLEALGMRRFVLDGAELYFDRSTGLTIHRQGPSTAGLVQVAPRQVQFGITNACNLSCGFCSRDRHAASAWTAADAFDVLDGLARAGTLEVAFGGGEPLAFRGFDALVARLHEETPLAVGVTTNGVLLTKARALALGRHVSQIRVSIYDDNDWRRTLDLLAGTGASFGVNVLVRADLLRGLEDMVLEIVSRGAKDVLLLGYVGDDPSLHLARTDELELADRVRGLAASLRGTADVKLGVCWGDRLAGVPRLTVGECTDCGAGSDFVVLTSDRCVMPCSFHAVKIPIATAADVIAIYRDRRRELATSAMRRGCARPALVQLGRRPRGSSIEGGAPRPAARPDGGVDTLHVFAAWASNNSGSYTLVGRFGGDAARAVGERLEALFRDMRAFYGEREREIRERIAKGETRIVLPRVPTPAHRFVEEHGLSPLPEGFEDSDEWPSGPGEDAASNVAVIGSQVVVHVAWTVSMPRALEEFFLKAGGRIELEIVHAHEPVAAVVSIWTPAYPRTAAEREARDALFAAVRAEVDAILVERLAPTRAGEPSVPWVWHADAALELGLVPRDPIGDLAAIRDVVRRHGALMFVRLFETSAAAGDLLAGMRSLRDDRASGRFGVVLWQAGGDRVAVLKAIREHARVGLEDAKALLASAPVVVLEGVSEHVAGEAVAALRAAGADAEIERPSTRSTTPK